MVAGVAVAIAVAGTVALRAAGRTRAARKVISTENMTYTIVQDTTKVGTERVLKTTYSDNVVDYKGAIATHLSPVVTVEQSTDLQLGDDSYFPIHYRTHKKTTARGHTVEQTTELEMFANVGVLTEQLAPGKTVTHNVVMPSGTAVLETGVIHHLYEIVHGYNDDSGGRQAFDIIDFPSGKLGQGVLYFAGDDTLSVMGHKEPVREYHFDRSSYSQKFYVDAQGRIVAADFGYMRYELTAYKSTSSE